MSKHSKGTDLCLFDLKAMTLRLIKFPTPTPQIHPGGNRFLRLWDSRSPCPQFGDSVSAGGRSFGPSIYWDCWRGFETLFLDSFQRNPVNHPWRGTQSHQGFQDLLGSGPDLYPEHGLQASSQATGFPTCPCLQCDSQHTSHSTSMEARSNELYH